MPAKQPKKGKGKKVTVVPDPTSAPPPAPAAAPNPEGQAVLDAHIANVGSEHFPAGYFPIPYTLTIADSDSFPRLPPLRQPLEAALFGKWDQPGNPYLVWRIDATRVNFALTRGVLSRFCYAVMGRYPTTLAVELKLSQLTLAGLNKTLKLCTAAALKEFVNVLALQEMPPQGLDPEEQWLRVDPVKQSGWKPPTATDAVVGYQTVNVQAWDAVALTEFSTNRRLRNHIPDITHPTLYTTNASFTMLGMGCPHPSFHNSYPVATHDIPDPPIVTEEGFAAAGYRQYDHIIPEDLWARLAELATVKLDPSMLEEVDLQAPGESGGRYQTTVSSVPHWLPDDLWQAVLALLGFSLPPLEGLEALCPKIIERWEAEPWKGFQIPHREFAVSVKQSLQCMVVFIPLTTSPPSKSLQVCPGTQGGYHAANRWDIVIPPIRSVTLLRGTVIHRGAGGPGRALFILFAPVAYRSRMLTVEPESVTELMKSVPVMPSELLAGVGSPLGTEGSPLGREDSLNFSPPDQGSEESAPAEAVPATDPVPAPQEDMPEAPAEAEERPAAPADADAAPPPQSAAQEANPVLAPHEEDMPEAPADAEERPAALADADAPPPPHRVRQRRTSSLPTRSPSQYASCRRLRSR